MMPRPWRLLLGAIVASAALAGVAARATAADLSADAALASARAAAHYMNSIETAEGRFLYEFDFLAGQFLSTDNIVRQAGGAYGLNEYVYFTRDLDIAEPARRALGYMQAKSVAYGPGKAVSADGTAAKATSGGTALAVLAAIYSLRGHDDADLKATARAWIAGLEALQLPNGGFPNYSDKTEPDSYASGEAWLALAHWTEMEPSDDAAAATLSRADDYLLAHYHDAPDLQFFHWGLQAAAKRFATTGESRFARFIEDQVRGYLTTLAPQPLPFFNNCAAVEGLVPAVATLARTGADAALVADARARLSLELANALSLQIQPGETRRTFDADRYYQDPKLANFAGGFLNSGADLHMRIDLTQHCLSGLVAYAQVGAN